MVPCASELLPDVDSTTRPGFALTGTRVRETIPDAVLGAAEEVVMIDLTPEAPSARMRALGATRSAPTSTCLGKAPGRVLIGVALILGPEVGYLIARSRRRGRRSERPDESHRILLPFTGTAISRRAVDAALRLARAENAVLMPAYLAEVPKQRGLRTGRRPGKRRPGRRPLR